MDTHTIFFIGKPGCGKGTQTKLLSKKTGWPIIKSGEQFRAIATGDSAVARKLKSELDVGTLSPYWFATYLYMEAFFSLMDDESVIFDGFNRKLPEAQVALDSLLWLGRPFTVIEIKISDETVRRRIALRKDIESRVDDSAVEERLKEYREYTEPVRELFKKAGVLVEIDGEPSPEEIAVEINKALNIK
jgi:adenylate kinase